MQEFASTEAQLKADIQEGLTDLKTGRVSKKSIEELIADFQKKRMTTAKPNAKAKNSSARGAL